MMKDKKQQYEILKKMSPEQRLSVALKLIESAKELKRAALRLKYKYDNGEQINARLKECLRHART